MPVYDAASNSDAAAFTATDAGAPPTMWFARNSATNSHGQ